MMAALPLAWLTGCQGNSSQSGQNENAIPPDLSIELYIQGDPKSPDPMVHTSRYLLEPDRSLHISVDAQAVEHTYPKFATYLTLQQMQHIAQLANQIVKEIAKTDQLSLAPSRRAIDPVTNPRSSQTYYHLNLSVRSQTHRLTTKPDQNPGVKALLEAFIEAGHVQPTGQVEPDKPAIPFHDPTP